MYRPRHRTTPADRRGVILLVVITMLTLFAVVGLTFVYYAQSEATASRIYREANDVIPDYYKFLSEQPQPWDLALGQLIYDVDDTTGVDSALRGHSLARTMYGWDDTFKSIGGSNPNFVPFNGAGRLKTDGTSQPYLNPYSVDDSTLINHTYFRYPRKSTDSPAQTAQYDFIRDPERTLAPNGVDYWRKHQAPNNDPLKEPRGYFTGGYNAPYTYPDHNNMFLAAVSADGTVLVPSFHRPWLGAGDLDPNNNNFKQGFTGAINAWTKYQAIRPLPSDHNGFPGIVTRGGDVQNIPNANNLPDSIWIDLGAPVGTLPFPDGRRYKPMFAFLVMDLDNRINVNTHGNLALAGQMHAANSGWGKWEVNPRNVLHDSTNPNEWKNLFIDPSGNGRYGPNQQPNAVDAVTNRALGVSSLAGFAGYDFDGAQGTAAARSASTRINTLLPTNFASFPVLSGGYDSSGGAELTNHPAAFDVFSPARSSSATGQSSDDKTWDEPFKSLNPKMDNLKGLIAFGPKDTKEWSSTDLGKALQKILTPKMRYLLTTHSADIDRAGASPLIWDPATAPLTLTPYNIADPKTWVPSSPVTAFQSVTSRLTGKVPLNSEYRFADKLQTDPTQGVDWRSALAEAGRLNLNIDFNDAKWKFPALDGSGMITNAASFQTALQKRTTLARAIFKRLQAATGAAQPIPTTPNSPEYQANRWLAQLAVNIVDYIDPDDYMTPLVWNPISATNPDDPANHATTEFANRVVFGTELPRVVLNEVYVQLDNNADDTDIKTPTDPMMRKANTYRLNVWVELHNPLNDETGKLSEDGRAVLYRSPTCIPYQILITKPNTRLRDPATVKGDPDDFGKATSTVLATVPHLGTTGDAVQVLPAKGAFSGTPAKNLGFFVAGPEARDFKYLTDPAPGFDPAVTETDPNSGFKKPTSLVPELSIKIEPTLKPAYEPTIILRRLACESLPVNDPADTTNYDSSKPYNPYITVDYVENVTWRDRLEYDDIGIHDRAKPAGMGGWARQGMPAVGRMQPYAAHATQRRDQAPEGITSDAAVNSQILHTFFRHNTKKANGSAPTTPPDTIASPFDWLLHLDRPLQNPMELLHVSGFKPHELTQQFMLQNSTGPVRFGHQTRWNEPNANSNLWRFLELVETRDYAANVAPGGRVPGRINLNTIWDKEVFHALLGSVDPSVAAETTAADLIWTEFLKRRTNGMATSGTFGTQHDPFTSFASGGAKPGVTPTLLRDSGKAFMPPTAPTAPNDHPYLMSEVLRRISNSTTVRSNVFAVWCTVGYFEVKSETTRPYTLGAEIGSERKRPYRSKFFAIVDRTALSLDPDNQLMQGKTPLFARVNQTLEGGSNVTFALPTVGGALEGTWNLVGGEQVLVGVGRTNQTWGTVAAGGVVTVSTLNGDLVGPFSVAVPHKGHTRPTIPGNPGPQPNFSYKDPPYSDSVVKLFSPLD